MGVNLSCEAVARAASGEPAKREGASMSAHISAQLAAFERELQQNPQLVERVLKTLSPVPAEPERIIKTSHENLDLAICRAIAKAVVLQEFWRVEIES